MKPGIFKSTTALAVVVSLAAPLPALSQGQGGKRIDLTQMSGAEIGELVDRCKKRADRRQKKLDKGKEVEEKSGPVAKFCTDYGAGAFDGQLPAELQSATVLSSIADMTAEAEAGAAAEAEAEVQAEAAAEAETEAQAQAEADAELKKQLQAEQEAAAAAEAQQQAEQEAGAEEQPAAEAGAADASGDASAEAIAQDLAEQQGQAGGEAQDDAAAGAGEQADSGTAAEAQQETGGGAAAEAQAESAASTDGEGATAEAIAEDLAGQQGQTQDQVDTAVEAGAETEAGTEAETEAAAAAGTEAGNPELVEQDSQAQADALAEAEAETAAAAAAAAASEDAAAEAEVIEETVTEETARSSDEEFETQVGETAPEAAQAGAGAGAQAPAPQANTAEDDDSGLSDRQRQALIGLGALAIGSLLNNGGKVVANTGDRAIVEQDGQYRVLKDDDVLLRRPGSDVTTYKFKDGSTRTVVVREDGTEVETIRAADGRVLRRTRTLPDGRSVVLFDDTQAAERVVVNELPQIQENRRAMIDADQVSAQELAAALASQQAPAVDRSFSLAQIRNIDAVRKLVPEINVDSVNFDTGSSVIRPQEAEELAALGNALREVIDKNPGEVFLIEGHTDAVGAATYNLALSDRRAETVALALTEYFDVPPENMVVQGYGESDLAVKTLEAERTNRRVAVRRITPLLGSGS
ncbi:OmpA family protein [Cribrihabitans neustonicus]|uniref:OmpA family protein n=1 Tax=Cribrihabitans neustonicus TaxID=1429085 RepID=UPI003B5CDACA